MREVGERKSERKRMKKIKDSIDVVLLLSDKIIELVSHLIKSICLVSLWISRGIK